MDNNLRFPLSISIFFIVVSYLTSLLVLAQQPYVGLHTTDCYNFDNSTSSEGYFCNGANRSCQAYLTFRAEPPYGSVSAIANLLGSNPSQLAGINSVRSNHVFPASLMVLVPVACSCSGEFYQFNTTYVVQNDDTYLKIANNTFQGLSNCKALQKQNPNISAENLLPGERITVPLRCACPTKNQSDGDDVKYLLSYLVSQGEYTESISARFGVDNEKLLSANELSDQEDTIYPFTTLLIPLRDQPTSVEVTAPQPPPPPSPENPSPPLPPPGGGGGGSSKTWVYAVVGAIVGSILVIITAWVVHRCFFSKRRRKKPEIALPSEKFESTEKNPIDLLKALDTTDYSFESLSTIVSHSLKVYRFEEIRSATHDFDPRSKIHGSSVYRGSINGDDAAIKKVNGDVSKEISLLNKINHFNLICLSGVCFEEGQWYLVYEYAPNGSLQDWIHGSKKVDLKWGPRLRIASDVANGLAYLHCYTSPPCIHKDLNCSNILLDQDLRAKISNFGLARFAEEGQDGHFAQTRHIVGTKGFMAPEYLENGLVSTKLDVYAFGVILLEILTGKEASLLIEENGNNKPLAEILESLLHGDDDDAKESLGYFMDSSLQGDYNHRQAFDACKLICNCLKKNPTDRPNMDEVAKSLSTILGFD